MEELKKREWRRLIGAIQEGNCILLHVLQAHGHRSRSLALEDPACFEHSDWPQTAIFFSAGALHRV